MAFERWAVRIAGIACCISSIYFIFDKETPAAIILMVASFVALTWYIWMDEND